jgi:predicted metal-dependent phosphoesterase TrpH
MKVYRSSSFTDPKYFLTSWLLFWLLGICCAKLEPDRLTIQYELSCHARPRFMKSAFMETSTSAKIELRQVFRQIDALSCPSRYNFHMHTHYSDGKMTPENLLTQAIKIGLEDMAITDHHSVKGYLEGKQWLTQQNTNLRLWIGTEITSYIDDVDIHILAFDFDHEAISLAPYLRGQEADQDFTPAAKVIDAIHQAGGLAVLAHPSRYKLPAPEVVAAVVDWGIDGIEVYYAYRNTNPWLPTPGETEANKEMADRYGLLTTCGTDTHGTNLLVRL